MVAKTGYYDPADYTMVHNKLLAKMQNPDAELTRLREIEKAARALFETRTAREHDEAREALRAVRVSNNALAAFSISRRRVSLEFCI